MAFSFVGLSGGWGGPGLLRGRLSKDEHYVPTKHGWNFGSRADGYPCTRGGWNVFFIRKECYVLEGRGEVTDWLRDVYVM